MSADTLEPPVAENRMRRVSSVDVSRESLNLGPTVVVPPKHLVAPSNAHETAAAMEMARHKLEGKVESRAGTPPTPAETLVTDKYAFAFDIDGVLIRGGQVIPEAIEAMKALNGNNEYGIKV